MNRGIILVSCNESSNAVSTEGSASCVPVDEAAVPCPRESVAAGYGADQEGETSRSFGEAAELLGVETANDLTENLVGEIFEAWRSGTR